MAISRWRKWCARLMGAPWRVDDRMLDTWIRDAFVPEMLNTVSPSTWDRLRASILERRVIHGYGMWMLDEPQRDPPEGVAWSLSERDFHRAQRLHNNLRGVTTSIGVGYAVWSASVNPNYLILMNW